MPTYTLQANSVRRYDLTSAQEWWLLKLSEPTTLSDEQLNIITEQIGITCWTDPKPGAIYRNTPSFRQRGHRLLISQRFGINA